MKDYDYIMNDPQQRDPEPIEMCDVCGEPIYNDYYRGWYMHDPKACICAECIDDVIAESWDDFSMCEKLEALGITHEVG